MALAEAGPRVARQRVELSLDFGARRVHARTVLDVRGRVPGAPLRLHARAIEIIAVTVDGAPAAYTFSRPAGGADAAQAVGMADGAPAAYTFSRAAGGADAAQAVGMADGAPSAAQPEETARRKAGAATGPRSDGESAPQQGVPPGADDETPELVVDVPTDAPDVSVAVSYVLDERSAALRFHVSGTYAQAHVCPPSSVGAWCAVEQDASVLSAALPGRTLARTWLPCLSEDAAVDAWELEYDVPPGLHVVSSGALCQEYAGGRGTRLQYRLDAPAVPGQILWAAGPFAAVRVPGVPYASLHVPAALAGRAAFFASDFVGRAFDFPAWFLGAPGDGDERTPVAFPYASFYAAYVRGAPGARGVCVGANIALLSTDALAGAEAVEQAFVSRALMATAVCAQFFGQALRPAGASDAWAVVGALRFVVRAMLRTFHGHNEHAAAVRREAQLVAGLEAGASFPHLSAALLPGRALRHVGAGAEAPGDGAAPSAHALAADPAQDAAETWLVAKAHGVLRAADSRLGRGGVQRALSALWAEGVFSVSGLVRAARRATGRDISGALEQWAGPGASVSASFVFNRRRSVLEVSLRQGGRAPLAGPFLVRVHETEGVYDHVVHVSEGAHAFELPVHARARKVRRRRSDAPGDDDGETVYVSPVAWVRFDPEMEWAPAVDAALPEEMAVEMLQGDRDVLAQLDALDALFRAPTDAAVAAAAAALADVRAFHRVRVAAAHALAGMLPGPDAHAAPLKVVWFYNRQCALQAADTVVVPLPRPLSFSPLAAHLVARGVLGAMARICVANATLMELVGQILLNALRYHDAAAAGACDGRHVAAAMAAAGRHVAMRAARGLPLERVGRDLVRELERFVARDAVAPSLLNAVAAGAIRVYASLAAAGVALSDAADKTVADALRPGSYVAVRLAALAFVLRDRRAAPAEQAPAAPERHDADAALEAEIFGDAHSTSSILQAADGGILPAFAAQAQTVLDALEAMLVHEGAGVGAAAARFLASLAHGDVAREVAAALAARRDDLARILSSARLAADTPQVFGSALAVLTGASTVLESDAAVGEEQQSGVTAGDSQPSASNYTAEEAHETAIAEAAPRISLRITLPLAAAKASADSPRDEPDQPAADSAPAADADMDEAARMRAAHASIWAHYDSLPFRYPVPASVPGYYEAVAAPIDLSAIGESLRAGSYGSVLRLADDLRRMFANCFFFNVPGALVCEQAERLRTHAARELRRLFPEHARTLRAILYDTAAPETSALAAVPADTGRHSTGGAKREKTKKAAARPAAAHTLPAQDAPVRERMLAVVDALWANPVAYWFQAPVDPVALQLPTYTEVVREPMDLGTLRAMVAAGQLDARAADEFPRLLLLIFDNCMLFNAPSTVVHQHAAEMRRDALRLARRAVPEAARVLAAAARPGAAAPPLPDSLRGAALSALDAVCGHPLAAPFLAPVDVSVYPSYRSVVRRPVDLGTMRARVLGTDARPYAGLTRDGVTSAADLHAAMAADVRLMVANCERFNGRDAPIAAAARELGAHAEKALADALL